MWSCPEYRLRLFLSVDLVGSTAYKAGEGSGSGAGGVSAYPQWVDRIGHFYREFPKRLSREFERRADAEHPLSREFRPQVWKTIGDEIVFCVRLRSSDHLAVCVEAFLRALESYGTSLTEAALPLDVKGASWVAAFPTPNVTVPILGAQAGSSETSLGLETDEELERRAEQEPGRFDFLGKEIDAGFRVSKHSRADRFSLSVELAYLLADACVDGAPNFRFVYSGRDEMKGVLGGRPYPVVCIDTERRPSRRNVRALERSLTREHDADAHLLRSFLEAFMADEGLDRPLLPPHGQEMADEDLPLVYRAFEKSWLSQAKENAQRIALEDEAEAIAEDEQPSGGSSLPEPGSEPLQVIEARFRRMLAGFDHE